MALFKRRNKSRGPGPDAPGDTYGGDISSAADVFSSSDDPAYDAADPDNSERTDSAEYGEDLYAESERSKDFADSLSSRDDRRKHKVFAGACAVAGICGVAAVAFGTVAVYNRMTGGGSARAESPRSEVTGQASLPSSSQGENMDVYYDNNGRMHVNVYTQSAPDINVNVRVDKSGDVTTGDSADMGDMVPAPQGSQGNNPNPSSSPSSNPSSKPSDSPSQKPSSSQNVSEDPSGSSQDSKPSGATSTDQPSPKTGDPSDASSPKTGDPSDYEPARASNLADDPAPCSRQIDFSAYVSEGDQDADVADAVNVGDAIRTDPMAGILGPSYQG